jgi:hypothetical protein
MLDILVGLIGQTTQRRIKERLGKDLEGNGLGKVSVQSWHLIGRSEENHQITQNILCPSRTLQLSNAKKEYFT